MTVNWSPRTSNSLLYPEETSQRMPICTGEVLPQDQLPSQLVERAGHVAAIELRNSKVSNQPLNEVPRIHKAVMLVSIDALYCRFGSIGNRMSFAGQIQLRFEGRDVVAIDLALPPLTSTMLNHYLLSVQLVASDTPIGGGRAALYLRSSVHAILSCCMIAAKALLMTRQS